MLSRGTFAGAPNLLRLHLDDNQTISGKLVQMDSTRCWLMQPDGWLKTLPVKSVRRVERTKSPFNAETSIALRTRLQREFGRSYEVAAGRNYVVVAPMGRARDYSDLLDEVYGGVRSYFAMRGFQVETPEFPLIAIVFADAKSFADFCRQDGLQPFAGLRGYYSPQTNRVAIFDSEQASVSDSESADKLNQRAFAMVTGNLRDTLVHEATHQIGFNTGLHARLGANPRWVVEGLATVFEAPGILDRSARHEIGSRINRERLIWFRNFLVSRRPEKSLESLLKSDRPFQTDTLDAYSEAWALSFYLIETQPVAYARYLQTLTQRAMNSEDSPSQRLDEFRDAFGKDLPLFEANYLRFMRRMSVK